MELFSFIFTIFFMLLGPLKLIPFFSGVTQGSDSRFKRDVAILGVLIAAAICAFVVLAGEIILNKYRISIEAVRIAGGLVLMISALLAIFHKAHPSSPHSGTSTASQLAASPVAVPGIVPPAGIAAILICTMLEPQYPGVVQAVALCLGIMLALDFLVMYFIDRVMKTPGLMIVLFALGSVLAFVQVALAVQIILVAFKHLGVIQA